MNLADAIKALQDEHMAMTKSGCDERERWASLEAKYLHWLNRFPDRPELLFQLGTYYLQQDKRGLAIALIERSVHCGALGAGPWLNIAAAYKQDHNDQKALEYYNKALAEAEKNPPPGPVNTDKAFALHGIGSVYVNAGQPQTCKEWSQKALAVDPTDRHAMWNKGLAHLELGEWEEGFRIYDEAGFDKTGLMPTERKLKTYGGLPKWDGTPGKTVVTYGEQGVGDEIMFCSMIPDLLKDCKVIIDCDKRIEKMLKRSFPDVEAVYPTSDVNAPFPWKADHKIDAYLPMGSLGKHYRKKSADFPKVAYLKAAPEKIEEWGQHIATLPKGLNVGISWAGGLKKTRFDKRSISLDQLAPVLETKGVNFISLQYHPWAAAECANIGSKLGVPIYHWGDAIAQYEDTAGLLMNLDLVITVNTSLHHLAGSLGVRQWCMTPVMCAWRYGVSGPSPWYGNCEMYRQKNDGDWKHVISRAAADLAKMVQDSQKVAA
jgi:tetratricopeptide (TPR) repeat protein